MNNGASEQSESLQQPTSPQLCSNNCGYFANSASSGYCSKCFRDQESINISQKINDKQFSQEPFKSNEKLKTAANQEQEGVQQSDIVGQTELLVKQQSQNLSSMHDDLLAQQDKNMDKVIISEQQLKEYDILSTIIKKDKQQQLNPLNNQKEKQDSPSRCQVCNKRVGLTGFYCKCDKMFCSSHRLAEAHNCSFDYKGYHRQKLLENNPLVIGSKVDKF